MSKAVVLGDVHLHPHKAFAVGVGKTNSRFVRTLDALEASLARAREEKCIWIQAGDWIHTIGFAQNLVLNSLISLLRQFSDVEKYTVWGNHDARTLGSAIKDEESITSVLEDSVAGVFVLSRRGIITTKSKLRIYGEGYQSTLQELRFPHWCATVPVDIGVFHQTVSGSRMPSGMRLDTGIPREWLFKQFRLSICGDVHEPQSWREGDHVILVPGSLEPHNFGDTSSRGWYVVSIADTGITWEFVESRSPKFVTVEKVSEVQSDGNYYRITTPTDAKDLPPGAVALAAPPTVIDTRTEIVPGSSAQETLSTWMRLNSPPQSCDREQTLAAGLKLMAAEGGTALRPVRLKRADLNQFLCHSKTAFVLEEGITLVLGQSRDFDSNGAGKSTLFEAIFWALSGRTTKGVEAADVIQYGKSDCQVALTFDDGLKVIRERFRDGTSKLRVYSGEEVWGGTPKEVTANLQKHLGLTPELFQALAYFSQSRLVLFSQASDAERKTMLSDLCGLDTYQRASTAARALKVQAEQEISQLSAMISLLQQGVQEAESTFYRLKKSADDWGAQAEMVRLGAAQEIEKIKASLFKLEQDWHQFQQDCEVELFTKGEEIAALRPELEERARASFRGMMDLAQEEYKKWKSGLRDLPAVSVLQERRSALEKQLSVDAEDFRSSSKRTNILVGKIAHQKEEIAQLQFAADKCPICGSLFNLEDRAKHLQELTAELEEMEAESRRSFVEETRFSSAVDQANRQIGPLDLLIQEKKAQERQEHEFSTRIKGFEDALNTQVISAVDTEIERLQKTFASNVETKKKIREREVLGQASVLNSTLSSLQEKIQAYIHNPWVAELKTSQDALITKSGEVKEKLEISVGLDTLRRIYDYWTDGFSRTGIQSLLMEEISASFNYARALVFPALTNGIYDVQFSTLSEASDGRAREKTDFVIRDRGMLVSYESLSGGQRRRIDLGVMLTLALAVSKTRNVPGALGIMVLDEVFGFLDQDGVESLYSALVEINKTIPAIYAVTHNPALMSLFERTLTVKQDEHGASHIVH